MVGHVSVKVSGGEFGLSRQTFSYQVGGVKVKCSRCKEGPDSNKMCRGRPEQQGGWKRGEEARACRIEKGVMKEVQQE